MPEPCVLPLRIVPRIGLADHRRLRKADLAASTQAAIVEVLVKKSMSAMTQTGLKRLVVAGGVGANAALRSQLNAVCKQRGIRVLIQTTQYQQTAERCVCCRRA